MECGGRELGVEVVDYVYDQWIKAFSEKVGTFLWGCAKLFEKFVVCLLKFQLFNGGNYLCGILFLVPFLLSYVLYNNA